MLNKGLTDTRTKILEAAFELFGRYGFEGTSVRQISTQSGVNLAAINYHFQNKDNLFWEIMARTYRDLDDEILIFSKESKDTVELACKTFDHFSREQFGVKNAMKMMLDEGIQPPQSEEIQKMLSNPMGPPGGLHFANAIQRDVPYQLNEHGLMWGVKSVFGSVFHWAIMMCTDGACGVSNDPAMAPELVRTDVRHMVLAAIMYLKQNEATFGAKK